MDLHLSSKVKICFGKDQPHAIYNKPVKQPKETNYLRHFRRNICLPCNAHRPRTRPKKPLKLYTFIGTSGVCEEQNLDVKIRIHSIEFTQNGLCLQKALAGGHICDKKRAANGYVQVTQRFGLYQVANLCCVQIPVLVLKCLWQHRARRMLTNLVFVLWQILKDTLDSGLQQLPVTANAQLRSAVTTAHMYPQEEARTEDLVQKKGNHNCVIRRN